MVEVFLVSMVLLLTGFGFYRLVRAQQEAAIADKRTELDAAHEADVKRLEEQQAARSDELATAAQELEASIKAAGKELAEDVVFAATGEVIARAGTTSKDALATLRKVMKGEIEAVDRDTKEAKASAKEKYDTAVADLTGGIDEALAIVDRMMETICRAAGKPMYFLGVGVQGSRELEVPEVRQLCGQAAAIWTRRSGSWSRM